MKERGTTVIETLIATAICMVVVFGLAGMVTMSTRQSREMGTTVAQASSLASQKLDQLLWLPFIDNTPNPPTVDARLGVGGSLTCAPAACTAGYIDYLTADGQCLAGDSTTGPMVGIPNDGWCNAMTASAALSNPALYFIRRWEVSSTGLPATLLSVRVSVEGRPIARGVAPSATVASMKAAQ